MDVGSRVAGKYTVVRQAADEMLGRVYLAEADDGTRVDVKVLHPHMAANPEKFARFGREHEASRKVEHPGAARLLDWGQEEETRYLVFEHFDGHLLQEELDRGPVDPDRAAQIVAQVASVLIRAHEMGVVHRNLSPQSLAIGNGEGPYPRVMVRDFGLAQLDDGSGPPLTGAATRIGGLAYMAPEYLENGVNQDVGDIYALGVLFFQMVTGTMPYPGKAQQIIQATLYDPAPVPSERREGLPPWCDRVARTLMLKDPVARPTAEKALGVLITSAGVDPVALVGKRPAPAPAEEPDGSEAARQRWLLVGAVGAGASMVALALVCVGGAWVAL